MHLLIITQKVDRKDPILGFFCRWIEEFSKHCTQVTVIGQQVEMYSLPSNVKVYSLGKEEGRARFLQIVRFWKLQWSLRHSYDTVFVHMTPIWIVLGAPLWVVLRKPMYLWYEIRRGSWKLSLALMVVRKVFSATVHGLPRPSKKQVVVGHGVEVARGQRTTAAEGNLITIGRVTRVKNMERIIECFSVLDKKYTLNIYGGTITKEDCKYKEELWYLIKNLGLEDRVDIEWLEPEKRPFTFSSVNVYLHAAAGGLDKSVLEAMAAGCLVLSASEATKGMLPAECQTERSKMPEALQKLLALSDEKKETIRKELRAIVERDHNLIKLIDRLVTEMTEVSR